MDPLTIINGDCMAAMLDLPEQSVQCCVTSPPYYGLRDYGNAAQIGLEESPAEYVAKLVQVFRGVRRVMKDDGTLWLNLGDSYAGSGRGGNPGDRSGLQGGKDTQKAAMIGRTMKRGSLLPAGFHESARQAGAIGRAWVPPPAGLKNKDMIGIPWMVAFALRADGWYLRSDIVWAKPNPMPESIEDRPTKAHEYIFLLSKSQRYYYDHGAIKEPASEASIARVNQANFANQTGGPKDYANGTNPNRSMRRTLENFAENPTTRNKRTVWTVPSQPYAGAHFATFPPDLIKPCVLAGAGPGGVVLDPFAGSGTTGMVALELGRRAVLIELNPEYCALIRQRCAVTPGLPLSA